MMRLALSTSLFVLIFSSIGDLSVVAKKSSGRPRAAAPPAAKLGRQQQQQSRSGSRLPPVSPRRTYDDDDDVDDDDDEDEESFGKEIRFPGDGDEDDEEAQQAADSFGEAGDSNGGGDEDDEDILGPVTSKGRRPRFDDDEEVLTPLPNKRRKGEPPSRRETPASAKYAATAARAKGAAARKGAQLPNRQQPPNRRNRFEDEEDDEEEIERPRGGPRRGNAGPPPARGDRRQQQQQPPGKFNNRGRGGPSNNNNRNRGGKHSGAMVPHQASATAAAAFTRGLAALRQAMPDPATVKDAAFASLNAARQTTSLLSTNLRREVKGLVSSELEQVMLKATRPDDSPVKGKHAERLVGLTYQMPTSFDIYDAVLRKLWRKMTEKDWRTKIKALYLLHRYSADGSPSHAAALKARLREFRRTRDSKQKDKFFNSKQLLAGEATPENASFRAFMSRYAHYVLLRAQCFSGMFEEISKVPPSAVDSKKPSKVSKAPKPLTATSLRKEHLEAATVLLKAGVACQLKEGEENENTAIAVERVASDLIGLTTAVAISLNRVLKEDDWKGADRVLIKKWCEFYRDDLVPQTRAMVKKTSSKLDAYGLFLPSRMGTSVSPELLQKGVSLDADDDDDASSDETNASTALPEGTTEEGSATNAAAAVGADTATKEPKEKPDQAAAEAATKSESETPKPSTTTTTTATSATKDRKQSATTGNASAEGEGDEDDDEYEYEDDDDEEDEYDDEED